jgi:maltose alpha-D-glucosyltransferase/alpha-amylase
MRLYDRGIRRRIAPMLGDRRRVELATSALLSFPGTPVIRYGDEIGMGDNLRLPERAAVRTPMQWSNEAHAGFSTSAEMVHPVVDEGPYDYRRVNVEAQQRDADSLFRWTASMIRLRKECPEIGWGTWKVLGTGSPHVLAMRYEWRGNAVVMVHNFADRVATARIRPDVEGGERLIDLRAEEESNAAASGAHEIVLDAYAYRWYRVGNYNYPLHRARQ